MGAYQTYPIYKDSKIEWVGGVPENWDVKPLFGVATTESVKNENGEEENVLSLSYGNIIRRDVDKNFGLLPESFNTYQLVKSGELILRLTDLQNDKRSLRVGRATEKGIITSAYLKIVAKNNHLSDRYLYRLLHSYDTTKVFYGMGGGLRQSMKFEEMRRLPMIVPSLEEQEKIANFLDHEIVNIDTLIEKQQQLIKLLKEKRQAVISHAVTKGLKPNASMRDSGVEWLGEVPVHWDVKRLKFACVFITKKVDIGNKKTIALENIEGWSGRYIATDSNYSGEDVGFNSGDVLFGKLRPYLAKVFFTEDDGVAFGDLLVYRAGEAMLGKYCFYQMINEAFISTVDSSTYGSKMPRASADFINNMEVLLPPMKEQVEIVTYIESVLTKFDNVEVKAKATITLIQERRTALISAAVTGKIDVRNWKAPESSNTANNKKVAA